jgi:hypothetical protein
MKFHIFIFYSFGKPGLSTGQRKQQAPSASVIREQVLAFKRLKQQASVKNQTTPIEVAQIFN